MSKFALNKTIGTALAAAGFFLAGAAVHAGPVTHITILGLSSNPSFTAGVATNTPTTTIFINTFGDNNSVPDAGETVTLEILDNGTVIPNAIDPASFTTQGGILNGGNASLPITFFRAGTSIQLRATAAGDSDTSAAFTVVAGTPAKLIVYGGGITYIPGTNPALTTGLSGTFTPVEANQQFDITVVLTDNQFNPVSGGDTVDFSSTDLITLPSAGPLTAGQGIFNATLTSPNITRTIHVTDSSDPSILPGDLVVTTQGPPANEVFPFPSPFNPTQQNITFRFRLDEAKSATLIVTNLLGQEVWRNTVSGNPGFNDVSWDGRNDRGVTAAVGVYYVLVEEGGSIKSKKRFGVVK